MKFPVQQALITDSTKTGFYEKLDYHNAEGMRLWLEGACRDIDKLNSFELWGIYVDPFMKRQGIGSVLVRYCEEKAIERRFNEVCLWVLEKNASAREFYKKLGYSPDGSKKFINMLSVSEIRYTKNL